MSLFVDTWGWVALQNKREARHAEVKAHYREFREREGVAYTTDYVLDETTTLLFKRLRFAPARAALQRIDEAVQAGTLRLVWSRRSASIRRKRFGCDTRTSRISRLPISPRWW